MIIIIGILLAIAIPSYLKFRDRANKSAAQANVRASIPAVEAYYADNDTYAGATLSYLQSTYDQGVKNIVIQSVVDHDLLHPEHRGCRGLEEDRPRLRHRRRRLPVNDDAAVTKRALRRPLLRWRVWRDVARRRGAMVVPRPRTQGAPVVTTTGVTEDPASGR